MDQLLRTESAVGTEKKETEGVSLCVCLSQEMFDATLKDREQSFDSAPGTTMFLHWLVGMVYVFYFASFILLLREVGRRT